MQRSNRRLPSQTVPSASFSLPCAHRHCLLLLPRYMHRSLQPPLLLLHKLLPDCLSLSKTFKSRTLPPTLSLIVTTLEPSNLLACLILPSRDDLSYEYTVNRQLRFLLKSPEVNVIINIFLWFCTCTCIDNTADSLHIRQNAFAQITHAIFADIVTY
jgi:hypothetical protein